MVTPSIEKRPRTTIWCEPADRFFVSATKRKKPIGSGLPSWLKAMVFGTVSCRVTRSVCSTASMKIWNAGHPVGVPPPEHCAVRGGSE